MERGSILNDIYNRICHWEKRGCHTQLYFQKKCWNPTFMDGNMQDPKNHFPYFYLYLAMLEVAGYEI